MDVVRASAVLGIGASASLDEVERAFRRLAPSAHPDRGGDPVRFQELVEARRTMRRAAIVPRGRLVVVPDEPWWRRTLLAARASRRRRRRSPDRRVV